MMRTLTTILALILLSFALASISQARKATPALANPQADVDAAHHELEEGAHLYRAGDYVGAERHFRRALGLDPTQKDLPRFIARAIQQQFKLGDESAEANRREQKQQRTSRSGVKPEPTPPTSSPIEEL